MNLLERLSPDTLSESGLSWEHPPLDWSPLPNGGIRVIVPEKVDYFQDPTGSHIKDDAPYLWKNVTGDFVARAHVRPTFTSTWDAGVVMARHDEKNWCKICFESTDLGTTAAVSVVTRGTSDDANGADLTVPDVWLQIFRTGNVFGMHYALDGSSWRMVRIFRLDVPETIKVGLVAQCPGGPGTTIEFLHFSIEERTVRDKRGGK
jgi:uncharacterized protein